MIITAEKNELLEATLPSIGFASNKSTIASIEGILFNTTGENTCEICAYDLEKGMKTVLDCKVEEQGCIIINCSRFIQIIKTMPDGLININTDEKTMKTVISSGKAKFELQAMTGKDFPDFPELKSDNGFIIKQCDIKSIIQKTQFAIAVNNTRPELNGMNFQIKDNKITAVSCDGNRLAVFSQISEIQNISDSNIDFNIIIPGKMISELVRFIGDSEDTLKINVARKHIMFFIGRFTIFTRMIDASYIDYDRFIPKSPKIEIKVNTAELQNSLERALLVTEEKQQGQLKSPVILNINNNELTVTSSSVTGRVNDEIFIDHSGDEIEIGFNCRFLYDAIRVCDCERVKISLTSPLMGMTVERENEEEGKKLLLLILPVRLNK